MKIEKNIVLEEKDVKVLRIIAEKMNCSSLKCSDCPFKMPYATCARVLLTEMLEVLD